jgi:hypothetical protein
MRQVETDQGPRPAGCPGHASQVEGLPADVLHARPQHQGDFVAVGLEIFLDFAFVNQRPAFPGRHFQQAFSRIEAVKAQLGFHRVSVGGKGVPLDQDLAARPFGPEKADHHEMEIDGERVHDRNFVGLRPKQVRQGRAELFALLHPGLFALEMPPHRQVPPGSQVFPDCGRNGFRLEAK